MEAARMLTHEPVTRALSAICMALHALLIAGYIACEPAFSRPIALLYPRAFHRQWC